MKLTTKSQNADGIMVKDDFQGIRLKKGESLEWVVYDLPDYEKSELTVIVETNPLSDTNPVTGMREKCSFVINKQNQEKINNLYLGVRSECGDINLQTWNLL